MPIKLGLAMFRLLMLNLSALTIIGNALSWPSGSPWIFTLLESSALAKTQKMPNTDIEEILVRRFDVVLVRKSRSQRVYLFSQDLTKDPELSSSGKLILIKRDATPVMAFRVLRAYGEKNQFAAKTLKDYQSGTPLAGDLYSAVEKVGSKGSIALTVSDKNDLAELEGPPDSELDKKNNLDPADQFGDVLAFDPELDSGSSPTTSEKEPSFDPEALDPFDEKSLIAEELRPLDPDTSWLSFNIGILKNNGLSRDVSAGITETSGTLNLASFGVRYGYTVSSMAFLKSQTIQDSLVPELGLYYYTVANYTTLQDNYTILPLHLSLRYNILFGETIGIFGYLGVINHLVISSDKDDDEELGKANLAGARPALGLGLLFLVGPNWNVRLDFGLENTGAGLILRF